MVRILLTFSENVWDDTVSGTAPLITIRQIKLISIKLPLQISNLLIKVCFCSFDLFYPILEKDIFIKNVYNILSCFIK